MDEEAPTPKQEFAIGEGVYYEPGDAIGIITDARFTAGQWFYRIDYCQGKDPAGPRGGNGPVWREGFPRPITKVADALYVLSIQLAKRIEETKRDLKAVESDWAAAIRLRQLFINPTTSRTP